MSDWRFIIANVVKFYEGGVQYKDAKQMPLYELIQLEQDAAKIAKEIKDEII